MEKGKSKLGKEDQKLAGANDGSLNSELRTGQGEENVVEEAAGFNPQTQGYTDSSILEEDTIIQEDYDPENGYEGAETSITDNQGRSEKKKTGKKKPVKEKSKKTKKSKKKKVIIIVLLVVVIAAVAFGLKSCGKEQVTVVGAAPISIMDIREEVSIKGNVQGSESADVVSALDNTISRINVKEGDRVKKGQILAVLDAKDLQSSYDQAKSQYEQAQYALQDSLKAKQNEYDSAILSLNESKLNYDANKQLFEQGAISKSEFLKFESDYLTKQATVNSFDVSGGKVVATAAQNQSLEVERLALEAKRDALDDINIKSPIDGTVTRVNATIGRLAKETGSANAAMFVIENVDSLEMNVKIGEYDINKLAVGQPVTISSDVLGMNTVTGVVSEIAPTGEEQNNNGNVEMVIPVKIKITEKNDKLIAGVTAKAVILVNEAPSVLAVPIDALAQDMTNGENYVLVVNSKGILEKRVVELGLEGDFYTEVTGGELAEGDSVALNVASSVLAEGMKVQVQ